MMSDAGSDKSKSDQSAAEKPKKVIKIGSQREGYQPDVPKEPERPKIDGTGPQTWDATESATPAKPCDTIPTC